MKVPADAGGEALVIAEVGEVFVPAEACFDPNVEFEHIAVELRPLAIDLDRSWNDSEAIKQAAVDQIMENVASDREFFEEEIAAEGLCRATRRKSASVLSDRPFVLKVETLSFALRHGLKKTGAGVCAIFELEGVEDSTLAIADHYREATKTAYRSVGGTSKPTPGYTETEGVVAGLVPQLASFYSHIYIGSQEVINGTASYVGSGLRQAESFAAWLQQVEEEQDGDFRALLQMYANDLLDEADEEQGSMLGGALETITSESVGSLHINFLEDVMSGRLDLEDTSVKDWVLLFDRILTEIKGDNGIDVLGMLVDTQEEWPAGVLEAYKGYVEMRIDMAKKAISSVLGRYLVKRRGNPTKERLADVLQAAKNGSHTETNGKKRPKKPSRSRSNGNGRARASLKSQLGISETERAPQNVHGILKRTPDGFVAEKDEASKAIDKMIADYANNYPGESGLIESLRELCDYILEDPYGPGTVKITNLRGIPMAGTTGKPIPMRRATTRHHGGAGTGGSIANKTRVVYAVIPSPEGKIVAIRDILHHNDFDVKYVASKQSSRLTNY